jgi:hypothetical protein
VAQSIRAVTRPIGNIKAKRRSRGVTAHRKCGAKKKHREVMGKQLAPPDYSGMIEYRLHNKRILKPLLGKLLKATQRRDQSDCGHLIQSLLPAAVVSNQEFPA